MSPNHSYIQFKGRALDTQSSLNIPYARWYATLKALYNHLN